MADSIQLFAKQAKIYPRRVWGRYRKLKWAAMILLLAVYYLAPWLRWSRGEHAPDQAILIDMAGRRAYFFGIEIWPQEVYYLTGILILAAVGLFFVTSLFGRVWCGYACPQTVWTDLFVWVERLVQGDRNQRRKLDEAPWGLRKLYLKLLTHAIWLVIGLLTGGAWVFYFSDAPTLMDQILHLDIPWNVGGWILGLTFSTYLMAGFAREQVCTYMCPYSRFQSAMFDPDTLVIAYDDERGEPRGKWKRKAGYPTQSAASTVSVAVGCGGNPQRTQGDCIDCEACVLVCPMGIDIRQGLQMPCIACGLCIDACNQVMDKIGLPRGLIRYDTESRTAFRLWRPRTFWYLTILSAVGGLMLYALLTRSPLEMTVFHDRNPLFVRLSDGTVRNGYQLHILNKTHEDRVYRLRVKGVEGAVMKIQASSDLPPDHLPVFADSIGQFRLFITAPKPNAPRMEMQLTVEDVTGGGPDVQTAGESIFVSERP